MITLYRVLTFIMYPLIFLFILIRILLNKEDPKRYKEKLLASHFKVEKDQSKRLIWFHASSIGEFKSIMPIIQKLNLKGENFEILITTTTYSSSTLAKDKLKKLKNVRHRFFPIDASFLIDKFLNLWKPDRIFLVDSEIWPNLILLANQKKIPIALLNARLTKKTFNRWLKFKNISLKIFSKFELCLTANAQTGEFLKKLGANNIFFYGNIKLIEYLDDTNENNINSDFLNKKRFWFAASTHEGEEILCLKTHKIIKNRYKDIITIIAPRHIDRVQNIKDYCENLKLNSQLLNKGEKIEIDKEIIIINSYGILKEYFKYAKSVFIGKSSILKLKNNSGQNPLDAAKFRCKIYHGPYVANFQDIYQILQDQGISKKINSHEDLSFNLLKDLEDPLKGEGVVSKNLEAICKKTMISTMDSINKFIL